MPFRNRILRTVVACCLLASATAAVASADDWVYVDDDYEPDVVEIDPCGEYGDDGAASRKKASDSEAPGGVGEYGYDEICERYGLSGWTTKQREAGTAIFQTVVEDYGLSGACAAGLIANMYSEGGFQYNSGETRTYSGLRYAFESDDDWTIPPAMAWYPALNGQMAGRVNYEVDGRSGVTGRPWLDFRTVKVGSDAYKVGEYPDENGCVGNWMVGGVGLFGETPYTIAVKYAYKYLDEHPEHTSYVDGERHVWDPSIQISMIFSTSNRVTQDYTPYLFPDLAYTEMPPSNWDHMAWFTCADEYAYEAAVAWQTCYGRGDVPTINERGQQRYCVAQKFLKMMMEELNGGKSYEPDEGKIRTWLGAAVGDDGALITSSIKKKTDEEECEDAAEGNVTSGEWVEQALMYARDSKYGYSQDRSYSKGTGKNLDCSSMVYWCLVKCGIASLNEQSLGHPLSFYTGSMDSTLQAAGFKRHDFTGSYDDVPVGAIMLTHIEGGRQHTEIYLGKIDPSTGLTSSSGVPYTIGAHQSEYGSKFGSEGDQPQIARGAAGKMAWFDPSWNDEVSGVPASYDWQCYYTPDDVVGAKGVALTDALLKGDVRGQSVTGSVEQLKGDTKRLSERQRMAINSSDYTPTAGYNWCAAWVTNVFSNAGFDAPGGNARDMYIWCTSSDYEDLKPGMIVVAPGGAPGGLCDEYGVPYGHVGIYIGEGRIRHNIGDIAVWDVADWVSFYTHDGYGVGWGWARGVDLSK